MKKLITCVLLGIVLIGCSSLEFSIRHIYDGDSFMLTNSDEVRLIGIDAPERDEPGADESRAFLINLIKDKPIRMTRDKENTDKYQRLLRYAYVGDTFINAEMVKNGHAVTLFIPPNDRCRAEFTQMETTAKESKIGIWATDVPVYITDTGAKYHRAGCQSLAKSKKLITLEVK